MAGRQRFTFIDAEVTVEADPSNVVTTGGSGGGGGGGGSVELDDGQFNEIVLQLQAINDWTLDSASRLMDIQALIQNAKSLSSASVVELVDTQFNAIIGMGGGLSSVVEIEAGQYAGVILGLEAIEAAVYNLNLQTQFGSNNQGGSGSGGPNPLGLREIVLVELIDPQMKLLLDAIGSAKTSAPPRVYPPKPPPMPQWADVLGQVNSGTLLSPKGAIGSMAGGKVGMAVQLAETITDTLIKPAQFAKYAIQQLGEAAVKVAKNDGFGLITQGLDAASDALGKIPVVGKALAIGLDLASAGLKVFKGTLDSLAERGRELSRFNPVIANAAAMADVRKLFADIREANKLSSRYADLITKQQQIDQQFQEALLPLKEAIADLTIKLAPFVTEMAENLGKMVKFFTGGNNSNASLQAMLKQQSDADLAWMEKANAENHEVMKAILAEIQRRRNEKAEREMFAEELRDAARSIQLEGGFDAVRGNPEVGRLLMPM